MRPTIEELLESILRDIGERDKVYIHVTTIQGLIKRPSCYNCGKMIDEKKLIEWLEERMFEAGAWEDDISYRNYRNVMQSIKNKEFEEETK